MRAPALAALLALAACTVVPPHGFPRSDEREVVVTYQLGGSAPPITVPASGRDLTVLWLETDPPDVRESFEDGARQLYPTSDSLTIRCRYRVYEHRDADGRPRLPAPEALFPDAQAIRTVWRRDDPQGYRPEAP